ncbi:MAG: ChaB family protein [Candidatus Gastranaerophilales bacterium]|nr:ChaB family protein [Candidatus Gastranaerophilales bacterium]
MRYERLDDLPGHIKTILPDDYQEYYMDIFNNAYNDYQNEIIAHKIAIAAIEFSYPRNKGD